MGRIPATPDIRQAAVFVAEIGDVTRFPTPAHMTSWAALTPRHRESDTTVHRGPITKQGSTLVRWAAIEAVHILPPTTPILGTTKTRIGARRGTNIAKVAAARKLLTQVFYALRDGKSPRVAPGGGVSRLGPVRRLAMEVMTPTPVAWSMP